MIHNQPISLLDPDPAQELPLNSMSTLTLCCFNVRGILSNSHYTKHLLSNTLPDFIAVSEHWLHDYNLYHIHKLNPNYKFLARSTPRDEHPDFCKPRLIRGHGGIALGWRSQLSPFVSPLQFISSCRMVGVQLKLTSHPIIVVAVYLPARSGCTDIFRDALDQLEAGLHLLPTNSDIFIMGDFNADPGHLGGPLSSTRLNEQGRILHQFMSRWELASIHLHTSDSPMSHTYSSEAHSSLFTIDHILCSQHLLAKVTSAYTIQEDAQNTSDHIPIVASLSFLLMPTHTGMNRGAPMPSVSPRTNWEGTSKEDIKYLYSTPLQQQLQDLLHSSPTPPSTPSQIDLLLTSLTSTLLSTSANIPSKSFHPSRSPGWTSEMKATCKESKRLLHLWVNAGRPRDPDNPIFAAHKAAKKAFRQAVRHHRRNTNEIFFASLDTESDSHRFFRAVRNRVSPPNLHPPTERITFEGSTYSDSAILDGWATYFEKLSTPPEMPYNSDQLKSLETYYDLLCSSNNPNANPDPITSEEVALIVESLPLKKAGGPDKLVNEHLIYAGTILPDILAAIFNPIINSGYTPKSFRHGLIIPLPKGHNKDLSNPSNFRGITLLPVISKVFEKILLNRLSEQAGKLHPLQGGFRPGVSCIHTGFVLQEAISSTLEKREKAFVAFRTS